MTRNVGFYFDDFGLDMKCQVCCGGFNHDMKCQVYCDIFYHDMKCQVVETMSH